MPIARSPVASRSRSRTAYDRAAKGKSTQIQIDNPPLVPTPTANLGPEPPSTPLLSSQHPLQGTSQGRSRREESEDRYTEDQSSSSESEEPGNNTVTHERGRPRGRSSYAHSDPALVNLLALLTKQLAVSPLSNSKSSTSFKTPAMKAPESFDGSSTRLRNYLQACQLIFHNDEWMFSNDKKKVVYAVSFLTGKAGKWIEPYLTQLDNDDPNFLINSWSTFEAQLFTLFGDPNEIRKAEQDLDNLKMKDSGLASSYITDFRTLQTKISGWGERALMYHFHKGLPSRILDQLAVHQSAIETLQELMKATLDYDTRYHERNKEKHSLHPASSSSYAKEKKFPPNSSSSYSKTFNKSNKTQKNPPRSKTKSNYSSSNIAWDGTLKQKEKDRRLKEGLCTYCGEKHSLESCAKLKAKNSASPYKPMGPKN